MFDFEKCLKEFDFDLCQLCTAELVDENNVCPYDSEKTKTRCAGFCCEESCRYCSPKCPAASTMYPFMSKFDDNYPIESKENSK
ncbi:MAG: hypothetical protein EOM59_11700 [Clostridia bacterium]|nr:hypothetical protein [Clostridia bacterium]